MKAPPAGVRLVLEAVCVIKGIKPDRVPDANTGKKVDDYWRPSLRVLGHMHFLESLIAFDKVIIFLWQSFQSLFFIILNILVAPTWKEYECQRKCQYVIRDFNVTEIAKQLRSPKRNICQNYWIFHIRFQNRNQTLADQLWFLMC